jgi:hypothetical protein
MLVPGQMNLEGLLSGQPASRGQFGRAEDSLMQRLRQGELLPAFNSVDEALQYERQAHDDMEQAGAPFLPQLRNLVGGQ